MKNLKMKLSSLALVLSMAVVAAVAQPQGGQPQGGQRGGQQRERKSAEKIAEIKTDKMDQVLDLSDAQEKKIYAIILKVAQEAEKAREAAKAEREAKEKPQQGEKPQAGKQQAAKPQGGKPQAKGGENRPSREDMQAKVKERNEKKEAYQMEIMSLLKDEQKMKYAMMVAREELKREMKQQRSQQAQQGGKGQQQARPQQGKQQQGGKQQQRPQRPQPKPEAPVAETTTATAE